MNDFGDMVKDSENNYIIWILIGYCGRFVIVSILMLTVDLRPFGFWIIFFADQKMFLVLACFALHVTLSEMKKRHEQENKNISKYRHC